jgi:hypothetical protein
MDTIRLALETARNHSQAAVSECKAQNVDPSLYRHEAERLALYEKALVILNELTPPR